MVSKTQLSCLVINVSNLLIKFFMATYKLQAMVTITALKYIRLLTKGLILWLAIGIHLKFEFDNL
jgi:hypothetical protein